jgi:redox-sensitive bicupin YhaK (pirin superfamily)
MAMSPSSPKRLVRAFSGRPTEEGAGVNLSRIFGYREVPLFDPFLMLDDFGSDDPADYIAGFPWHPHRGIETVTYLLHGVVRHEDSLGNGGEIADGQVQWMTAGGGIIHQEMPLEQRDYLRGLQLWVNLPAERKMMPPRYQDIGADAIPEVRDANGAVVKVIAGTYGRARGPVRDIVCDPEVLDIRLPGGTEFGHEVEPGRTVFAYVLDGEGRFDAAGTNLSAGQAGLYGKGRSLKIAAGTSGARFLCVSGEPIGEPVAWRGPIVMNTQEELDVAFAELRDGTFLKK